MATAPLKLDLSTSEGQSMAAVRLFRVETDGASYSKRGRGFVRASGTLPGSPTAERAWQHLADATLLVLADLTPPIAPSRPGRLPDDDEDLRGLLRSASRKSKSKRTKEEKEALALFGAWRCAVLDVEGDAVGRLQVVGFAWIRFYETGHREGAKLVRRFLEDEYGMGPDVSRPAERLGVPKWATIVARGKYRAILPARLANYLDD